MASETIFLGSDAVLTVSNAEVEDATDVTVNLTKGSVDTTTRKTARNGWRSKSPGLRELSIDFTYLVRDGATVGTTLINAFLDNTILTCECLDHENGEGPTGDFYVMEATRGEPLQEGVNYKFKLEWTSDNGADNPTWTGGS